LSDDTVHIERAVDTTVYDAEDRGESSRALLGASPVSNRAYGRLDSGGATA
jgi:hypothetical protein